MTTQDEQAEAWRMAEYAEVCNDWRHRDGMLWQSLAVAITVTGLTMGADVSKTPIPWLARIVLYFLAFLLNIVVLVKIVKDHYYQHGSAELLRKMRPDRLASDMGLGCHDCARIHPPSDSYMNARLEQRPMHPRWLYERLTKPSTFGLFFGVQIFLVIFTAVAFVFAWHVHA